MLCLSNCIRTRRRNGIVMLLISLVVLHRPFLLSAPAQTRSSLQAKATTFRINPPEYVLGGKLFITVGGRERKISDEVFAAWIVNDGREVVYSSHDGAGGFENEGQSLRIYDVKTRRTRKILSEYSAINAVQTVRTSTGAIALLVKMQDGGLGGSYLAVVDPKRGEVFYRELAEVTEINGDNITLAFYGDEDWDAINTARDWQQGPPNQVIATTTVRPFKTEKHDLKKVLRNKVIYNRPTNLLEPNAAPPRTREVDIYLWEANSNQGLGLSPVKRMVLAGAPLRPTLEALFRGATKAEAANGLGSPTFGMTFAGVRLMNGIALVRFSQPKNETNYGSQGPAIFATAIEKTARQFPTVKKVEICAVGETMIDSELEKPFPKCPK